MLDFCEIGRADVAVAGGKGANLGELSKIEGVRVPPFLCVTTDAFRRIVSNAPAIDEQLDRLWHLKPDDQDAIRAQSAEIRRIIEGISMPENLAAAIEHSLVRLGIRAAYAVRSSATAEDMPTASFAGQQDTYLNVVGTAAILQHVGRCWASLFSERAVTYRLRNGIDHRNVRMAVLVQQMVFPHAAGVLFTADPITGNRKVAALEAVNGLGEALVSGVTNADVYHVRHGEIIAKAIAAKPFAIHASPTGGTERRSIDAEQQRRPALTDTQVTRLAALGRRIEAHFGRPQDIEWCLVDDDFEVVQSRPITTLFPIPETADGENHVVHLRRPSADDDRSDEAARDLLLADDHATADGRRRRTAIRRRHTAAGVPGEFIAFLGGLRKVRSVNPRCAAKRSRSPRLHSTASRSRRRDDAGRHSADATHRDRSNDRR